MPIPESRPATMADAFGILLAQNQTAAALSATLPEEVTPWTAEQVGGILENAAHPRGQFLVWASDPIIAEKGLAGFLLCKRYRAQPPEPDPTVVRIVIACARIEGTPLRDRARLRRAFLGGMKALIRYCHVNGLTWEGRILKSPNPLNPYEVENVVTSEMVGATGAAYTLSTETRNGRDFWLVRSGNPVVDPDTVGWPDS